MTGKQLKEFAAQVHDEAIIEVKEMSEYGCLDKAWNRQFEMQAPYIFTSNPSVPAKDSIGQ